MIISIISHKGGVAKTTSAIHIAGCLAKKGSAMVIDGDFNRSAIEWNERGEGLPFKVISIDQSVRYAGQFDFTVVDTMARPDRRKLEAVIESSDKIILASASDALSISATELAIADLDYLKADFSILLTMIPPLSNTSQFLVDWYKSRNLPIYKSTIRRYAAFQKAAAQGRLICDVADDYAMEGWRDYQNLVKEILK